MNTPIKRHEALKPLSREHHHGLLLCWKIRQGFKLNVEPQRIKEYIDWFQLNYLNPHFEEEERFIFPVLGNDHTLVQRALAEHQRLKELFNQDSEIEDSLHKIGTELDKHIKFEERVLFNEIQKTASASQMEKIQKHHHSVVFSEDDWKDHFWITPR